MNVRPILTKSISSLLLVGTMIAGAQVAPGATIDWDGGSVGGTELGDALNWTGDILPSPAAADIAQWNGTVAGPLSLVYSTATLAGAAGNPGLDFNIAAGQVGALNIDSTATAGALRMNNLTIAAGAGAFSLGNSADTFTLTLGGVPGTHSWTNDSSNTAIVASDVRWGLGGSGAHTLAFGGSGNWTMNTVMGVTATGGSGTLALTKNGTGTLTLTAANTYTGGTVLNAGAININNAGALGNTTAGALTINGGTIDNTSGTAVTTTTAKAQNWNGDFTFTGSNNLNFNGGVVTLGGSGSSRTVNVNGGTLTVGSIVGTGYGLTKAGAGTLTAGTAISRITGDLNVTGGTFQIGAQDFIAGGLTGSGTVENGSATGRWLFIQNNADNTFSGTLRDGSAAGTVGLNKAGTGTLTLSGPTSYTHQTTILGGTLEFGSSSTPGISRTVSTGANTGLVFDRGDGGVKSSFDGTGAANLTFGSRVVRTAGATGNFIVAGGTNGVDNRINLTQAAGFISQGMYFNGENYAWMDAANTFVRPMVYGADSGALTSGAATSLTSVAHQEITGAITAQETATFTTLKNSGNSALTLASGATVTVNGILKSGNVAGGAIISGGAGIQAANGAELVIRTDRANDSLTIATPILANGTNALTTSGAGTLTLSAANTYTGTTTVNSTVNLSGSLLAGGVNIAGGGTLNLTGTINGANAANGLINVGWASGGNAVLNIDGGTLNARAGGTSLAIGNAGNASGFVKVSSGTLTTANGLAIGNGTGAAGANPYAALTVNGGTVTSGSWLVVGGNNDRAVLNQTGGSITVGTNRMTIGAGGSGSIGVVNLSGGTFTDNGGIFVGENGTGILNVSGSAAMSLGTGGTLQFAGNASSVAGTVNLLGGTISANSVTKGTGTGTYRFNFNGGTLRATATNGSFFASLANTQAYVNSGGAHFDTNGFDVTVAQPLLAPAASGLSSIGVASGGAGYLDTPIVTITGGTGTGAQAVANVSGGVVTGFTITNPGTGYSPGDILSVSLYGGGATTPATVGTLALAQNVSGGLTKNGSGTLTLNGANTFTGNVVVNTGTLVANAGNIGNPTTSALGNATVAGRTVTVNSGATLRLGANDVFGNGLAVPENLPSLIVNGTLSTARYNQIGAVTLNGATLSSSNTTDSGNYQNFQFLRDVTVGGNAPSFISSSSAPGFDANHLGTSTTFNVADVTGNANTDLTVSAPFRDQSGNYGTVAGSLVKTGAGKMELSGTSTYTGSTTINAGTLQLSGSGSISSTSGITIDGNTAKLVQTSETGVFPFVTLTNGTIDGTKRIEMVTVADLATNTISNGNGSPGEALTIGILTFEGDAKLSLLSNGTFAPLVTDSLTTGEGLITIDVSNTGWNNGSTYDLVSYSGGTVLGSGFSSFTKGTIGGLGARQSATLGNSGTAITLAIAGDLPVWTGLQDGNWTTTAIGGASNWKLQTGGTATDFITNDAVLFDDTAAGTTTVNISAANVSPITTTFNNSAKTYTVSSTGGFGIATGSLTKNGTGTLNLGGNHSYTGLTLLNAGTTNLTGSLGNTAVTVSADATLNLQAANAISQNTVTVNGTVTQTVDNALSGTAAIVLNNGATLAHANTHSGGTTLNAGALNINHATALGTGLFTISGGTLSNTSGGAITLANNNPQEWSNDAVLTFAGTNALNLGTGAVTFGSDSSAGSFTITNNSSFPGNSLTVAGEITPGTGASPGVKALNIDGTGSTALSGNITKGTAAGLVINHNTAAPLTLSGAASNITTLNLNGGATSVVDLGAGNLTVANGGGNIVQSATGGTINATGGGSLVLGGANGDFGTAAGTTLTVNAKISGTNSVDFWNANEAFDLGTIVLAGANDYTGATNVQNTKVVIPVGGAINALNTPNVGQITVGDNGSAPAVLSLEGGTINATKNSNPSFAIGAVTGAIGVLNQSSGTINTVNEFQLGRGQGAYAAHTMSGGTLNSGSWLVVGLNNDRAILNQSGGSITVNANRVTIGAGGAGSVGVVNQTGGSFTVNAGGNTGIFVGENGTGTYNLSGTAALTLNTNGEANSGTLQFAGAASSLAGNVNLNGGTLTAAGITKGTSSATGVYRFNFNGGTLKANRDNAAFFNALANATAYVNSGGAIIDDGGFAVTVAQPLLAPTGNGLSKVNVTGGTGYLGAPLVEITGDGTGATAVADIDAEGNLTGITITNPGVNYTSATVTVSGGGGFGTVVNSVDLAANTSGGFTKKGDGTLTLSGANTYTGPTIVESGTLAVTGSISGSTSIEAKSGTTLDVTGVIGGFVLADGQTLSGTGRVSGSTLLSEGSTLAPGEGAAGTLTSNGDLNLALAVAPAASGSLQFELGSSTASDKVAFTSGALTIGTGVLGFDDFTFTSLANLSGGTYTLFDGNMPIIGSLDPANLTGSLGGGFTGTLGFSDNGNDLTISVVPEPGTATLLLAGLGSLCGFRRFRRRSM